MMKNIEFLLGNAHVTHHQHESNSEHALIYFPGFPGPAPDNPVQSMEPLLVELANEHGFDLIAPHYEGLGKSGGRFSFLTAKETSRLLMTHSRITKYKSLTVFGYSFGGHVALDLNYTLFAPTDLILLAPFLNFPYGMNVLEQVSKLKRELPKTLEHMSESQLIVEFQQLNETAEPLEKSLAGWRRRLLISASDDDVVDTTRVRGHFQTSGYSVIELEDDHQFTNRAKLKEALAHVFRAS